MVMKVFLFVSEFLSADVKADLLFLLESFRKQCSLTTTLTVARSF